MYKKIIILILLLTLIASPRFLFGWQNLSAAQKAEQASEDTRAAEQYQLAAQRLFWKDDLLNNAAQAYLRAGQREEAIRTYQLAQKEGALSALGYDLLGQAAWEQDDLQTAYDLWQEGQARYPNYLAYQIRLAFYYREKGNYTAERDSLSQWLQKKEPEPTDAPYYYRLGILFILDDPTRAQEMLDKAARADEQFASVVETLRATLNLAALAESPAENMITRGRGLGLAEEWQLAASLFYDATQTEPGNASAWAWLGEAYYHLGEDSLPALDKALSLQPKSDVVRSLRGLYFQREGELERALGEFEAAASQDPENEYWQIAIGENYARLGNLPPALAAYEEAVKLAPANAEVWNSLALFSAEYGVQVEEVGLPAAQRAVALSPENAVFADTLGWVNLTLANDEEAEKFFLHALSLDPELAKAHLHLGIFYLESQRRALAYRSLLDARRLGENTPVAAEAARLLQTYFNQ